MGNLIRLFLADGRTDGMRTMEISNMTIKATIFPRPLLNEFAKRDEAKRPGVYMLFGQEIDESTKPILYIGEGDPVLDRLKDHGNKKDFWIEAFVFTSKDDYLTKTQIQYLESRLIAMAQEASRVTLDNQQSPSEPSISEVDRTEVQQFLEATQIIIGAMRINFFTPIVQSAVAAQTSETVYEFAVKNAKGKMVVRDGKYILLAGSLVALRHVNSANAPIRVLRDELKSSGALVEENGLLLAIKDIPFNSASYAAAVVSGGNVNGLISWKHNGRTLKQIETE